MVNGEGRASSTSSLCHTLKRRKIRIGSMWISPAFPTNLLHLDEADL